MSSERGIFPKECRDGLLKLGFFEQVDSRQVAVNSLLCVGLDPDSSRILQIDQYRAWREEGISMGDIIFDFNRRIIEMTHPFVCAYKPNKAFYEEHEFDGGLDALKRTVNFINETDPSIPVILDAKRTDIGKSNEPYVRMVRNYGADAITVNPYFGLKALEPFLNSGKGVVVLCRTSNPEVLFQDLVSEHPDLGKVPLYLAVAYETEKIRVKYPNVCLVVGATWPRELEEVRKVFRGEILVPGLGAQGGKPEDLPGGLDLNRRGIIANNASGIIYRTSGNDFAVAAGDEARRWRDAINKYR